MQKPIDLKNIYQIFFTKDLVDLSMEPPRTPIRKNARDDVDMLTPISKSIYDATSPRSKEYILHEMMEDDEYIENMVDLYDPDYQEKMENNGLGFFMENYISMYCKCPLCGEYTLKKFVHSNVPVIDLVCTNRDYHLEHNKCFIFQLKISLTYDYFSLVGRKIVVGSKKYGMEAHIHKGSESIIEKTVVPGYICIRLHKHPTEIQKYFVDYRESFVLVPNYQSKINEYYYKYLDELNRYGKNIITWNPKMVEILDLHTLLKPNTIQHEVFMEREIGNPYEDMLNIL